MYEPDRWFLRELRRIDPHLRCEYDHEMERFVLKYQRCADLPVTLSVIEDENGGFRFPDNRELLLLGESDTHRVSVKDRLQACSKYMADYRAKQRRNRKGEIRDMTKDGKIQMTQRLTRAFGFGKGNSAFRRVNLKQKGKTLSELQGAS